MNQKTIILASSSPRRIEIMKKNGVEPIIIPPDVSEELPEGISPRDAVMFLALKKALRAEEIALSQGRKIGETVIAADTVVFLDAIMGKPESREEARSILKTLCGKTHFVMTGVAILEIGHPEREVFCETTQVLFDAYSDAEIDVYIDTPEPYDKAGGYAIQGAWGKHVKQLFGSYDNVMGFPWAEISAHLDKL